MSIIGKRSLGAVFLATVATVLLFWTVLPDGSRENESQDFSECYAPAAQNLLAGRGYVQDSGAPETAQPPGYSLLLAGLFATARATGVREDIVLDAFNLFCAGLAAAFLFALARSVWDVPLAFVTALAWITCPFGLWLTRQPSPELPFLVLLYLGLYLLWRLWQHQEHNIPAYFGAGMLFGIAALVRSVGLAIGAVVATILFFSSPHWSVRVRLILASVLLAGNLVVFVPWEAWLYANTGRLVPLSTNGPASMRDGLTFAGLFGPQPVRVLQDVVDLQRDLESEFATQRLAGDLGDMNSIVARLIAEAGSRPRAVLKLLALKAVRSWYATDTTRLEIFSALAQLVYLPLIVWGTIASYRDGGRRRQMVILILGLVLYFWLMTAAVLSILRYMVPAMGLLFVLLPGVLERLRRNQVRAVRRMDS